jgi:hypothetical protein
MEVQVVFMDIRLHLNQRAAHNPSQRWHSPSSILLLPKS